MIGWRKKQAKKLEDSTTNNKETKPMSWEHIKQLFKNSADISFSTLPFESKNKQEHFSFCYHIGLTDLTFLNDTFLHFVSMILNDATVDQIESTIICSLQSRFIIDKVSNDADAIDHAYDGDILFQLPFSDRIYYVNMAKHPNRTPDEPNTEVSVIGPRDGFIEDIDTNIALVRKRLRTNSLHCQKFTVGKRTKTKVALLYIDDIIDPEIKADIISRINNISIDGLISRGQFHELIGKRTFQLFPLFAYTGRPDFSVDSLLRGRFIILTDGLPTATIGPANFFFMLKSAEDNDYLPLFNSFERFIRLFSLFISIFLPGFYVALTSFHQDQIPFLLLKLLVTSRSSVPFPAALEAFIMLGLFELFREAGLRMPFAIGQTLTVVGGIIIGDAAIRAGLASPALIIIIAISLVATYTFTDQVFAGGISISRYFVLSLSSFLGLVGFYTSLILLITYLARIRVLSIPYLTPFFPLEKGGFIHAFLRIPWNKIRYRSGLLKTKDTTRQGGKNEES